MVYANFRIGRLVQGETRTYVREIKCQVFIKYSDSLQLLQEVDTYIIYIYDELTEVVV